MKNRGRPQHRAKVDSAMRETLAEADRRYQAGNLRSMKALLIQEEVPPEGFDELIFQSILDQLEDADYNRSTEVPTSLLMLSIRKGAFELSERTVAYVEQWLEPLLETVETEPEVQLLDQVIDLVNVKRRKGESWESIRKNILKSLRKDGTARRDIEGRELIENHNTFIASIERICEEWLSRDVLNGLLIRMTEEKRLASDPRIRNIMLKGLEVDINSLVWLFEYPDERDFGIAVAKAAHETPGWLLNQVKSGNITAKEWSWLKDEHIKQMLQSPSRKVRMLALEALKPDEENIVPESSRYPSRKAR